MKYLLMLCIFLMQLAFWLVVYLRLYFPSIDNKAVIFILYGSYIIFVIIYFFIFYRLIKYNQLKEEVSLLEKLKHIKQQQKENIEIAIEADKKKQEQIVKHLHLVINELDYDNYDQAKELFYSIYDDFKANKLKTYCNNAYVNAVLVNKKILMDENQIRTTFDILLPQNIDLDVLVLPTILFNILDNAIQACQICKDRFINLSVHFTDTYISIYMKNSNSQKIKDEIKGVHGYGMKIVEDLINENGGTCEWKNNGETFESMMMLRYRKVGFKDGYNSNC